MIWCLFTTTLSTDKLLDFHIDRHNTDKHMDLLENISNTRPANVAIMGLDVGKKTIGVALSDSTQSIAFPICTIKRTKFSRDIKALEKIIREYDIGGYVIGLPLHMDNSEGRACQSIRDFGMEFARQLPDDLKNPWIALWDERLSTAHVSDFVDKSVDISRRKAKDRGIIDQLAAQHILQGALDFMGR